MKKMHGVAMQHIHFHTPNPISGHAQRTAAAIGGKFYNYVASATPYLKTKETRWRTLKTLTQMNWRC